MKGKGNELQIPEWMAVLTVMVCLGFTVVVVYWQNGAIEELKQTASHPITDPYLSITIEGAVGNPGTIKVKKGSLLQEALQLAEILPDADLSKLKLDKRVRKGQKIWVPSQKWVVLEVEELGKVKVPKGTRFNELPKLITIPEGVDRGWFRSKKVLKDGEKIILKRKVTEIGKDACVKLPLFDNLHT